MADYRYFFSASVTGDSPPLGNLPEIFADSPREAILALARNGDLPRGWESLWIHLLVWRDNDHGYRGFESHALAEMRKDIAASLPPSGK